MRWHASLRRGDGGGRYINHTDGGVSHTSLPGGGRDRHDSVHGAVVGMSTSSSGWRQSCRRWRISKR